jgi:hypothetical protein
MIKLNLFTLVQENLRQTKSKYILIDTFGIEALALELESELLNLAA